MAPSPIPQVDGTNDRELAKTSSSPPKSESHGDWEHCDSFLPGFGFVYKEFLELKAMCREEKVNAGVEEGASGVG